MYCIQIGPFNDRRGGSSLIGSLEPNLVNQGIDPLTGLPYSDINPLGPLSPRGGNMSGRGTFQHRQMDPFNRGPGGFGGGPDPFNRGPGGFGGGGGFGGSFGGF